MHTVIANAWRWRSVQDRHALPVHGEHGLELIDERPRTRWPYADRHRDPKTRESTAYPRIIYSDAYLLGNGRLHGSHSARYDIPGTLGLHFDAGPTDLVEADGPADSDSPARGSRRTATSGRSKTSFWILGAIAWVFPGLTTEDGTAQISGMDTPITIWSTTSANPVSASLAWAGVAKTEATNMVKGAPNPRSVGTLHRTTSASGTTS